jgi:EpsI family protein
MLAIVAPVVLYTNYDVPEPASIEAVKDNIPEFLGGRDGWEMVKWVDPEPDEVRILETKAILRCMYELKKRPAPLCELSLVFAQDNRRAAHPPEICYKGAGWSVQRHEVIPIPINGQPFYVNRLLLLHRNERMWVLYWFKTGSECCASYLRMQWNIIKSHLLRRGSSSALIRLSVKSRSQDEDQEVFADLLDFAKVAIPAVNAVIP